MAWEKGIKVNPADEPVEINCECCETLCAPEEVNVSPDGVMMCDDCRKEAEGLAEIAKAFDVISSDAIGTGAGPEAEDDWNHPSARAARELTDRLGLVWEFTTWAETRRLLEELVTGGSIPCAHA